jgi:hypothetical protein
VRQDQQRPSDGHSKGGPQRRVGANEDGVPVLGAKAHQTEDASGVDGVSLISGGGYADFKARCRLLPLRRLWRGVRGGLRGWRWWQSALS